MAITELDAVVRRLPLVGWSRPACPPLPSRVQEIANIAATAEQEPDRRMAEAAHALNKAALLASDCGLTDLAQNLCWQHINVYREAGRRLTVAEVGYMLEPVHNLARLQIRAEAGEQAIKLLSAMHQAVEAGTDLTVDGQKLPLADPAGTREQCRRLRQWIWLQLLTDGIRALTLAGRWDDAVQHATNHKGIGLHLMEGRQAAIVTHVLHRRHSDARAMLDGSTPTQPWEHQVMSCLRVICADPARAPLGHHVTAMVNQFRNSKAVAGFAVFRARLGLTVATIVASFDPARASTIAAQVAAEVVAANDGYAAREILRSPDSIEGIDHNQHKTLGALVADAGLGNRTLPEPLYGSLTRSVETATQALAEALCI